MIYREEPKRALSDIAKGVNMNEVFVPRNNTELAADLQDVEIRVINGRAEKVVMATVVGRDEFVMLSYNKLKQLFAKNNWSDDALMIFTLNEYREAYK